MLRPETRHRLALPAALSAVVILSWPALAETAAPAPAERLEQVEKAIDSSRDRKRALEDEAARLAQEAADLKAQLIRAAAAAQNQEAAVTALEDRLAVLIDQEQAKASLLRQRRHELAVTLSALARLSRTPPEAMIASPEAALDTLRSSLLLGKIVPELEQKAAALKTDLEALTALRRSVGEEQARLATAISGLDQERKSLDRLLQEKSRQQQHMMAQSRDEGRRAAQLAAEASDLKSLLEKLAEEDRRHAAEAAAAARAEAAAAARAEAEAAARATAEAAARTAAEAAAQSGAKPAPTRLAALPPPEERRGGDATGLPARGRVIGHFGQPNDNGVIARGITIETRPSAEVTAPASGKIVFAGPFRGYGQLLIIAHAGGYHILLAGFARIDGTVGQLLSAGEPVGRMGSEDGRKPNLYVELRRNGEPINPIPWLAASERKVSG